MELTASEAWSRILERARTVLPENPYRIWLSETEPLALSQDLLAVGAGSEFAAEWIEDKYGRLLADLAEEVLGRRLTISFQHHADADEAPRGPATLSVQPAQRDSPPPSVTTREREQAAPAPGEAVGAPLNERYTFDRFVVGSNNQLAAAAARAVAESPARMYNPLFIYGGVGLGKTHLMHAIGHVLQERDPTRHVAYVSSEWFTNDLIASIQEGSMSEFRRRYRGIDLLLIDDVHFLGEKERTQEEFFHTFNALHDAQRQIVLTSDRPPKEIPGLEERLVSRFEWGLVTDIRSPDLETRVAILRKKAADGDIVIDDEVLEFIARNCRSNVRELEGAVIKLLAYSSLTQRDITTDLAREALGGVLAPQAERSPDAIREHVARAFGVEVSDLTSKRRTREVTVPRQVAMYLMRELLDIPLARIGDHFGGRDHSTVIHSINKVEQEMEEDAEIRERIDSLRSELGG
ncbi:MAG TPA: chromosomal replication initiator protein DnaA [Longimicrobiales bacterium]|nr:chromosomal replication initiator protein DnaA [Longimicrobiales bacterium]